jgi:hypothetical protein
LQDLTLCAGRRSLRRRADPERDDPGVRGRSDGGGLLAFGAPSTDNSDIEMLPASWAD